MKWDKKIKPYYSNGTIRIVKKFLLFPKCLWNMKSNKYEYRWLEFAMVEQEYKRNRFYICWMDNYWAN